MVCITELPCKDENTEEICMGKCVICDNYIPDEVWLCPYCGTKVKEEMGSKKPKNKRVSV